MPVNLTPGFLVNRFDNLISYLFILIINSEKMAYNLELASRIRNATALFPETFTEKKMFGGVAFLYGGKMTVGPVKNDLMVRVIASKMDKVLAMENVRPMDFTGKPMKEFIFVSAEGYKTEAQLNDWIALGLEHAKSKLV